MADNELDTLVVADVQDVDDVALNKGDPDTGIFDLTSDELRGFAESGWTVYDEERSGNLQLDAATDHHDGSWGPTCSAVAYANSQLDMFFYFLPRSCGFELPKTLTGTDSRLLVLSRLPVELKYSHVRLKTQE